MHYDSFIDRKPFGAVVVDTAVSWQIQATEAKVCTLLLAQPDGQMQAHVMQAGPKGFSATVQITQAGVWYYAFRVETDTGQLTYAAQAGGFGGSGQVYQADAQAPWYQLTVVSRRETLPAWYQNARIYHIFVDRFNNGNADGHVNAPKPNSFLYGQLSDAPYYVKDANGEVVRWDFYGGNLAGITKKLDWLKTQGFTALYLSPIFEAVSNHRYDTADYMRIDPMLGTLADFKTLVAQLHQRGMRLILDGVFNHVGRDSRYFNAAGRYPDLGAAQSQASPYAQWFTFKHWPDDYDAWWGVRDLPAINKQARDFQQFIAGGPTSVLGYWTGLGVDGWRLDVVDELDMAFVYQIRALLDQYPQRVLIGEVWEDASHKIAYGKRRPYFEGHALQAVMNYPQRQLMIDYVLGKLSPASFGRQLKTLEENYPAAIFANNFTSLSTHDTKRVLTVLGHDLAQLSQLLWLQAMLPGDWVEFYGDAAGLDGGVDPQNRKYYPWGQENQAIQALYQQAKALRQTPAFAGNSGFAAFWDAELFGVLRYSGDAVVVGYFNTGAQAATLVPDAAELAYVPAALRTLIQPVTVPAHAQLIQPGLQRESP